MAQFTEGFVKRLRDAITLSDQRFKAFREERTRAIRAYVGPRYGAGDDGESAAPLNPIHSAASVFVPNLASHNPRFRARPPKPEDRWVGAAVQEDLNHTCQEINFARELRKCVVDSIFLMGISKCGLTHGGTANVGGREIPVSQIFWKRVSPDNYFVDPRANDRDEAFFEGDIYEVPLMAAQRLFPQVNWHPHTRMQEMEKAASIEGGNRRESDVVRYVRLADVWLPTEQVVLTITPDGPEATPLRVLEWSGRDGGPYNVLMYDWVPDNFFPSAPVHLWQDLHTLINTVARQLKRQAEREKRVPVYEAGAEDDAERLEEAGEGEWTRVDDIQALDVLDLGGITEASTGFIQWLERVFSKQSGNLDLMGGMASDASSATEASFLMRNSSVRITDMQGMVYLFAQDGGQDIAHYRWNDPLATRRMARQVPGTDIEVTDVFGPQMRQGRSLDVTTLNIIPHSMSAKQPEVHARRILEWWNNVVLPTAKIAMAQGYTLDVPALTAWIAEELGIREHRQFYRPMQMQTGAVGGERPGGGESGNQNAETPAEQQSRQRAEDTRTRQPQTAESARRQMPGGEQLMAQLVEGA
ncbi:MAG: hypothetical protein ACOC7S_00795 [Planctomycetota bacterium]